MRLLRGAVSQPLRGRLCEMLREMLRELRPELRPELVPYSLLELRREPPLENRRASSARSNFARITCALTTDGEQFLHH